MRGAVNPYGTTIPNYHFEDLKRLTEAYKKRDLQYPAIVVDTNHANSNKKYERQGKGPDD
jgi:3-deoxy-7-phosphoheptulonate synthase